MTYTEERDGMADVAQDAILRRIAKIGVASEVCGGWATIVGAIRRTDTTDEGLLRLCDKLDTLQQQLICIDQLGRVFKKVEEAEQRATKLYAHFSLTRLSGCHYKVKAEKKGSFIVVVDPQVSSRSYKIPASDFTPDKYTHRGSWAITQWSEKSQRRMDDERNWQS